MQDKHLCCPPYFFLDTAVPPHTFLILEPPLKEGSREHKNIWRFECSTSQGRLKPFQVRSIFRAPS